MPLKESKYKYNQTFVKLLGSKIVVSTLGCVRNSDIVCDDDKYSERCSVNDKKLTENIKRSKSKIYELACCNSWDWFFTATLDKSKYDRSDLEKFHKDLTQWFRNYGKQHNIKIDFLLVPELHSDGVSWHMHGLLRGVPKSHLKQFQIGDRMGKALAEKVKNGDVVYNWLVYSKKFGFCDLEPIRNPDAVSKYITKYINKDLSLSVTELNAHLFYHSRGLEKAKIVKSGTLTTPIDYDFNGEYCSKAEFPYSESKLKELIDSIV